MFRGTRGDRMTVKEIVDLLSKNHPFRLDIGNAWTQLLIKGEYDDDYIRLLQEYGDYNVIEVEACENGCYEYATLWIKAERKE